MKVIEVIFMFLTTWLVGVFMFGAIIFACGFVASIFTGQFSVDTLAWISILISFAFAGYAVSKDGDAE